MEKTLILIKPDGVARNLADTIIQRIKTAGLTVAEQKSITVTQEQAHAHYQEHEGKPFFPSLIQHITSGPIVAMIITGDDAIRRMRTLMGPTNPTKAPPGTIRGDLRDPNLPEEQQTLCNLIHGSDSPASAARELAHFFPKHTP